MKSYTLKALATHLNAEVRGDDTVIITGVASLEKVQEGKICFLANPKYMSQLTEASASAVLLSPQVADSYSGNAIIVADPYVSFARVAQLFDTTPKAAQAIHPSAQIDQSATIGDGVCIGANAVISERVILDDNVQIGAGCVVGQDSVIGANTILWANVTIYHNVHLGQDCLVQSGTVIGSDGFGYANEAGKWVKIPQTGGVRIGNRVEIGACTAIDRGAIDHTRIHDGVIIDNQIQLGHNADIGEYTALAGGSVYAGSVTIGKYCIIGGNSAVAGHLSIADGTHITGGTNITNEIKKPGVYSSATVAMENKLWRKNTVRFRQLDELFRRVKNLEKK